MKGMLNVLYIDDDPNDLLFFGVFAKQTDGVEIELQTATDWQQAIDYLMGTGKYADRSACQVPDLIVLDLRMPVIDGFGFLAWRQSSTRFASLPVIIFTGTRQPEDIQRALDMGANGVFKKSANVAEWKKTIKEIYEFGLRHRPPA